MTMTEQDKPKLAKRVTEKVLAGLNRADEIGGEIRDFLTDRVATDPRYVNARRRVAKLFGGSYESKADATAKAVAAEAKRKAAAAPMPPTKKEAAAAAALKGFGNPEIKAQVFGKKSCPWTGRSITILERNKVDFDFVDLEEPEHESKLGGLQLETKQHTVPFNYLRGQFIGGFNALAEIERLGQLEFALMSQEERAKAPTHIRVEIVARPNTDEVVPAEETPGE